jgi:hypothetical protein
VSRLNRIPTAADQARDRTLRAAFLRISSTLPSRPAPRSAWDEVARDARPAAPWRYIQNPVRSAVAAGAETNDVIEFYLTLLADALESRCATPSVDTTTAGLRAIKEQAEALESQAVAQACPTPVNVRRAIEETTEAVAAN